MVNMLSTVKYVPQFCIVHRPYDTLYAPPLHTTQRPNKCNNINRHTQNPETGTETNTDWMCKLCSYTNNKEVSLAVFGDYHNGRDGARFCIICYQYCATIYKETILTR